VRAADEVRDGARWTMCCRSIERPFEVPGWNFHKYLIGRDGYIAEVFPESVEPVDTRVKTAIARALAAS